MFAQYGVSCGVLVMLAGTGVLQGAVLAKTLAGWETRASHNLVCPVSALHPVHRSQVLAALVLVELIARYRRHRLPVHR
ncbi:hypothetical protein V8C26DRAFT_389486 [Trichoderma gracile]